MGSAAELVCSGRIGVDMRLVSIIEVLGSGFVRRAGDEAMDPLAERVPRELWLYESSSDPLSLDCDVALVRFFFFELEFATAFSISAVTFCGIFSNKD